MADDATAVTAASATLWGVSMNDVVNLLLFLGLFIFPTLNIYI